MAGPAPKTRNWTALENAHKPKGLHVIVSGHVQVSNTDRRPVLTESPERNPRNLGLALTITDPEGAGLDVRCWKPAFFHKEVKANEYDSVTIRWNGSSIAQVPVFDDREHQQHMAKLTQAANAAHPAKKKAAPKKAVKKAAAKKAAPKKASKTKAPKAVGGWAKKAKKKTAKKKTAKKSGLRRLVGRLVKKFTPAKSKKSARKSKKR
jgi:hypothetical protein